MSREFKERMLNVVSVAKSNLAGAQSRMKVWYDSKARSREFKPGDQVLAILPVPGNALHTRYSGPYVVERKVNALDYVILTPGRRKSRRLCHINMLKPYYQSDVKPVAIAATECVETDRTSYVNKEIDDFCPNVHSATPKLDNSNVLRNLNEKLEHLPVSEQNEISSLMREYSALFKDTPGRTSVTVHDVDVGDARPIKQHPYRMNPVKSRMAQHEIDYMLENNIIEISQSEWSSPVLLVPKPDGVSQRFVIDYRMVNSVSKTDSFPIPRIDDCIDRIGNACYVSKYDLLKGYWQVPLTDRAKEISAFVVADNLYQCVVMPFGMKNAPSTFQRMMNNLTRSLTGCVVYVDDVVIYSDTFQEHLERTRAFFDKILKAGLVKLD